MNNADHNMRDDDTEVIARQDTPSPDDATTEMDVPLSERFAEFDADDAPASNDGDTREMPMQTAADETTVVIERAAVDETAPTAVMPRQGAADMTRPLPTGWSWSSQTADDVADVTTDDTGAPTTDDTETTDDTTTLDATVIADDDATQGAADATSDGTGTPPSGAVPMYSAPQPPEAPKAVRPSGASVGTIVFGVVVTIIGALTILVGSTMNSGLLDSIDWRGLVNWTLMGLGVLLSVIAIVWGIVSHMRSRRHDAAGRDGR